MSQTKKDELLSDHNHDGIDRRGFLKCMAWAGTGALCVMQGGVLKSYSLSRMADEWTPRRWRRSELRRRSATATWDSTRRRIRMLLGR